MQTTGDCGSLLAVKHKGVFGAAPSLQPTSPSNSQRLPKTTWQPIGNIHFSLAAKGTEALAGIVLTISEDSYRRLMDSIIRSQFHSLLSVWLKCSTAIIKYTIFSFPPT